MHRDPSNRNELLVGAHTSAAGGVHHAILNGQALGATTIQLFTSNQKQWQTHPIPEGEIAKWEAALEETGIDQIMSHDSYLINLGSPNPELLQKSREAFRREIQRCHQLKIPLLNFHPGAATSSSEEECLNQIVASLKECAPLCSKGETRLLLETTAGQGTSVGHRFEHLSYIIEQVEQIIPIGVCIDTCHVFVAGYDIRTKESLDATLKEFDAIVGLQHLFAFHLNDSVKPIGSRVDRHAPLGKGEIGIAPFRHLMQIDTLRKLPKYLETPDGASAWKEEIALLKQFAQE